VGTRGLRKDDGTGSMGNYIDVVALFYVEKGSNEVSQIERMKR